MSGELLLRSELFANSLQLEDVFNRMVEELRNEKRQRKGRDIIAFFHGANRLSADANGLCELFLRNLLFLSEVTQAVIDCVFSCHMSD